MFSKILIANRGEIACRVIRTARRMGIKTVAVYSDADRDALHVEMADEAVRVGAPPAAESYLLIDRIVEACRQTGAEAVHPGYGFLSENARFPQALAAEGIVFIGPPVRAIEAMGDKIESKRAARAAGVSTVPGSEGVIESAEQAVTVAGEIGYPVMIKASAGGGGKGMRIAESVSEVKEGFERARSEARSSFGDDRVFIEKFIVDPRHIEIQVLGDQHGNIVYLGERECSVQRRNQKVVEEAPSPLLDRETRRRMGEQAVALARAVGYFSAGTVEFVAGQDKSFYFLEMNTRLQVEHPVTELVTGIDLVEQMIRIAAGENLPFGQEDIRLDGWAVESRVYAEDPERNFLPSIGRLTRYRPPEEGRDPDGRTVRIDTGVGEGGEISMYYDPMIAKLVTHGSDRIAAIDAMAQALDAFHIAGIRHNMPFLSALMAHPRWREGRLSTAFIKEEFPEGFVPRVPDEDERVRLAAVAACIDHLHNTRRQTITGRMAVEGYRFPGRRIVRFAGGDVSVTVSGQMPHFTVALHDRDETLLSVHSHWVPGHPVWTGTIEGEAIHIQVTSTSTGYELSHGGASAEAKVFTEREAALAALMPVKVPPDTTKMLLCPMPGLVVSIAVGEGQEVKAGETLAVVEAMKMENVLRAERDGVVAKVHAAEGRTLSVDDLILEFE
ncbi:acetyl-CoA carboxylase biotin carboxylase subunit [Lutibaculum baratangense]|uniref:propionyl-CoA carboxylase n=1 Tax=Lutibaculum baratangense AMV1 TaxID=631454 RepID=V4RKH5_9HYPH|nr:acetyl/propionyl/methylcrotonyl-CoA carboxylase subunit alpha [Lutibaculum baratangense]ESR26551.1 Biotin carboxylase [Lutibaculum baratangense AMV1]